MNNQTPDWLKVGAKVATVTHALNRGVTSVEITTVTKIGKRDVVLDNGQRFNHTRGLTRHDGSTWSGWTTALLAADDEAVAKARAEIRRKNQEHAARSACGKFLSREITAFDAILALAPLTGCADEIAALDRPSEES